MEELAGYAVANVQRDARNRLKAPIPLYLLIKHVPLKVIKLHKEGFIYENPHPVVVAPYSRGPEVSICPVVVLVHARLRFYWERDFRSPFIWE